MGRSNRIGSRDRGRGVGCCVVVSLGLLAGVAGYRPVPAAAAPMYVYTDAQGQTVMTDTLNHVPAEYRNRVRTMIPSDQSAHSTKPAAPSSVGRVTSAGEGSMSNVISAVARKLPPGFIKGLNSYQAAVVLLAGFFGVLLLLLTFLSQNVALRILSKCLLAVVCVGAVYHLYLGGESSERRSGAAATGAVDPASENVVQQMKHKTADSFKLQDARTTSQLDQVESPLQ